MLNTLGLLGMPAAVMWAFWMLGAAVPVSIPSYFVAAFLVFLFRWRRPH